MSGETPGQYGCAMVFLVLLALVLVGMVVTGGEMISWFLPK